MNTPHTPEIPELPEIEDPDEKPGNRHWGGAKLGTHLAAWFGYYNQPFLSILLPVSLVTTAEYLRFRFSRNTEVGWGILGLLLTSTIFCSILYGTGWLVAYWWHRAP